MKTLFSKMLMLMSGTLLMISCSTDDNTSGPEECIKCITIQPGPDAEEDIQNALITVENDGWTIILEEGTYNITGTLTMDDKSNVILKGEGMNNTILSFANQTDGGEGILITNSSDITVSHLEIADTDGDGLKVISTDGIKIDNVRAQWTGPVSSENGGYALYPVLCTDVVISNCEVRGASDAGIYVGQSMDAVVFGNTATENVAGIQIENTINADVYDNLAENNTGGIMVFDLPIPNAQRGASTRIFDNVILNNNHDNFAPPGGIVGLVPPGTGVLVMATKQVEVFDNQITDNLVAGIATFSFVSIATLGGIPVPPNFDPFFDEIYILDNAVTKAGTPNENQTDIGFFLLSQFGDNPIPDMLTDGIFSPLANENGGLCIQENGGAGFVNLDLGGQPPSPSFDLSVHDCSFQRLPGVDLP